MKFFFALVLSCLCSGLWAAQLAPKTMQLVGNDFVLQVCDDVAFTHYGVAKIGKDGRPHAAGDFVMTCPRSRPDWSLTIKGCPTASVANGKTSTYVFTC